MTKRLLLCAALVALGGCGLTKQEAPPLAGPSELGLSLSISASPDILEQDGKSMATIRVVARDTVGQPKRNVPLRIAVSLGGITNSNVSTGSDGSATVIFLAPPTPPNAPAVPRTVTIEVVPIGDNFDNTVGRYASILLVPPTIILTPGTPYADFTFAPDSPKVDDIVSFDGSLSGVDGGQIVTWDWQFGDGNSKQTAVPTATHDFSQAGSYIVTLTVTDNKGQRAVRSRIVQILAK